MKLTKFKRFRNAVANLDVNFVANKIRELREALLGHGMPLEANDTVVTEEGIYYINPRSGMATKVALYIAEQEIGYDGRLKKKYYASGDTNPNELDQFNEYHLVRCNFLTHDQRQGWKDPYRIVQRPDGAFYYRLPREMGGQQTNGAFLGRVVNAFGSSLDDDDGYEEIEDQRLNICHHCLIKINSLLKRSPEFTKDDFKLNDFFDAGFASSWRSRGEYSKERGSFADIYPKDWEQLVRTRRKQAQYLCENCNMDLSEPALQRFLYVQHADHLSRKVSYIRLRCLCLACRAEEPDGEKYKQHRHYKAFLKYIEDKDR